MIREKCNFANVISDQILSDKLIPIPRDYSLVPFIYARDRNKARGILLNAEDYDYTYVRCYRR
jgi:hypothetical protein